MRSAPLRSAPRSTAPRRSAPRRSASRRSAPARSAPARSRQPSYADRAASATARRAGATRDRRSSTSGWDGETAGGQALGLGDQGRDVGAPVGGVGEVPGDLVHLLDDEEVRDPVGLGDRLAGPEAVVGHAAAHARLAETVVDAAAGVGGEVPARRTRRLVEREVRRPREGQDHAAQPDAAGAVGGQLHPVRVSRARQESPAMRCRLAPREPWSLTAGQPPQGASQAACRRLASRVIEAWISRRSLGEPVTIL